jgi:hypothetical protein
MDQARISSIRSSKGVPGSGFASITAATNMVLQYATPSLQYPLHPKDILDPASSPHPLPLSLRCMYAVAGKIRLSTVR